MPVPSSPALHELARSVSVMVQVLWLVAAVLVITGVLCVGIDRLTRIGIAPGQPRRGGRRWQQRRGVRGFAAAVAAGDLRGAELAAGKVLCCNDARPDAGPPPPCGWDESVILPCSWSDATTAFDLDAVMRRFPARRRHGRDGTTEVLVGHRVRLRMVIEEMVPGGRVTFVADAGRSVLTGHLTLRPLPPGAYSARTAVEVVVHAEAIPSRQSRRVLRATRSVTKAGLRRWACDLAPT